MLQTGFCPFNYISEAVKPFIDPSILSEGAWLEKKANIMWVEADWRPQPYCVPDDLKDIAELLVIGEENAD